jgi:hypothetical protein
VVGRISYILEEGIIIYSLFLASRKRENVEEYPVFENHEAARKKRNASKCSTALNSGPFLIP